VRCDTWYVILLQEQQDEEYAQQPSKTIINQSRPSGICLAAVMVMSVAALVIATGRSLYRYHEHHIGSSFTRGPEPTTIDLSTSVGPTTFLPNIPFSERQALQDIYVSTNGAQWNYDSSSTGTHWSFDDPAVNPCAERWYGVHCVYNHITSFSLIGTNLIGTIPESLSQLTMLVHLDLGHNLLIGRVSTALCQIRSLVHVDLEGNSAIRYALNMLQSK